jgi:uncharacterized damage-inducible protein DinB
MATLENEITASLLDYLCRRLETMTANVGICLSRLTDAQIWERHGEHENAVGNLLLHLCGNMRQWVISGVGGAVDVRERDAEFSADGGLGAEELMGRFALTVAEARRVIARVPAERLLERITPQGRDVNVLEAILQVVGHVEQHVGQIVVLTKQMTRTDLDLTIPRKLRRK